MANDSFSQRSSHQRIVTRSPNHMWDNSCSKVSSRAWYVAGVARLRNTYSSRTVTQPTFSIAPPLYSGTKTWSYFPNGYGKSKCRSKTPKPSVVIRKRRSASRCGASDWRQSRPIGNSPAAGP